MNVIMDANFEFLPAVLVSAVLLSNTASWGEQLLTLRRHYLSKRQ